MARSRYDIVMCFECNRFDVYDGEGNGLYSSGFADAEEGATYGMHRFPLPVPLSLGVEITAAYAHCN